MKCKKCGGNLLVSTTADSKDHVIRYRECAKCGTTYRTAELLLEDRGKKLSGPTAREMKRIFEKYGYKVMD